MQKGKISSSSPLISFFPLFSFPAKDKVDGAIELDRSYGLKGYLLLL